MREQFREIATNFTPVRVVGIPGLTLVIIAIALAMQFPQARWLIAAGIAGGMVIAAALIARRRDVGGGDSGHHAHGMLTLHEQSVNPTVDRKTNDEYCMPWPAIADC